MLQTPIKQMNPHVFESNCIPFRKIGRIQDILTKLDKTLFSILGPLGHINHLEYTSNSNKKSWNKSRISDP